MRRIVTFLSFVLLPILAVGQNLPFQHTTPDGQVWMVQPGGFIQSQGNNRVFAQAGQLQINGQWQRWRDNSYRRDEKTGEIVLASLTTNVGLLIERRIRFDLEGGLVAIVDVFTNPGATEISANITFQSALNFGVAAANIVNDPQAKTPTPMGWASMTHNNTAVGIFFAGKRSKIAPTINWPQGSNQVQGNFRLQVPAGKTVAMAHLYGAFPSTDEVERVAGSIREAQVMRYLPSEIRRQVLNMSLGTMFANDMEILRGDTLDVIELRSGDLLRGTIETGVWNLTTFYGPLKLSPEGVLSMFNIGQFQPRQLIITPQGEAFGGMLPDEPIPMRLTSGQLLQVPLQQINRLGYRTRTSDPTPDDELPFQPSALFRGGERVIVEPPQHPLDVVTRYGRLAVAPESLVVATTQADGHGVHEMTLVDGSRFQCLIVDEMLALTLAGGARGQQVNVPLSSLLALQMRQDAQPPAPNAAVLSTTSGDQLVGLLQGRLRLLAAFDAIDIDGSQIRSIEPRPESGGDVTITLWDNTRVSGRLDDSLLMLRLTAGTSLGVPVALVERYDNPEPSPAAAVVEQVRMLVEQLSADQWRDRQAAEQKLIDLGPAIIPVLRQARHGRDPESTGRIDAILKQLGAANAPTNPNIENSPRPDPPPAPVNVRVRVPAIERNQVVDE